MRNYLLLPKEKDYSNYFTHTYEVIEMLNGTIEFSRYKSD